MQVAKRIIDNGIKRPIRLLLGEHCYPAALILMYSAIEMMAFLNLPREKADVTRSDFIAWADHYLTPLLEPKVRGKDLYGARCGVLRGTDSRLVREGYCRMIRYTKTDQDAAVISVGELANALFRAIDEFLKDAAREETRAAAVSQRLDQMLATLPF